MDNWFLKERFGLADDRLQPLGAILAWHTLVFAAYALVQYRRALPLLTDPTAALAPLAEVVADHRQGHAQQTVGEIVARARQGYSDDQIIAEFFPT